VTNADPELESGGPTGPGHWRRRVALSAPIAALIIVVAPLPLERDAQHLAAIFVGVIILWVTEVIPIAVTALLIAPLMILAGVTDAATAFAPYADPLLFLFVGGFMIARAMTRHGLDRRLAFAMISLRGIRGRPARVRLSFLATAMILSMWISNTASAAILLPILIGLMTKGERKADRAAESGSILAVAYGASIGGLGTPVGSPPNLIAMGFLEDHGIHLSFFDWMAIGLPTAVVMMAATFFMFQRTHPPVPTLSPDTEALSRPWSRGEIVTSVSFGLAVVGWMAPGIFQAADLPGAATVDRMLPGGGVAILAASVLYFVPDADGKQPVLPWRDGVKIDWGLVLLFGGGISLGRQMFETGLAEAIARGFVDFTGVSDLWTLVILVTIFTIFFTETCSNTATSNMLSPLVIAIAVELDVSPVPPVLAVGLAASCAFMLPIATGPNAIAYGTERVEQTTMIRSGFLLNLIASVVIVILLRILCPLYGWT
jgi:sodium-dependent dicarboxylate transporter 2/3/5